MSFSSELKAELGKVYDGARHCRIAQLAALVCFAGSTETDKQGNRMIKIASENFVAAEAAAVLIKKIFGFSCDIREERSSRNFRSFLIEPDIDKSKEIFETLKFQTQDDGSFLPDTDMLTNKSCCRQAFLRGAFISSGSVSNPDRSYHFEILCRSSCVAQAVVKIMESLGLQAKMIKRQKNFVVYLKEIDQISDAVGLMGARMSFLELENSRIIRGMRGNINRRVNCETANINKAAQAAARQIDDILYIGKHMSLDSLPNGLDEIAKIRLEYPEATLSELGAYLEPPIGKSGVNHRLRKLSSMAEALRSRGGSYYDQETGHYSDL